MERNEVEVRRSWRDQRMDEVPGGERTGEEEVEYVDLETSSPRRGFRSGDTRLDVEVVRVERPDFDSPITEDAPDEEESAGAEGGGTAETETQPYRERFRLMRQLFLGTILNNEVVRANYRYAIMIACLLFMSIAMLFWSLTMYLRYTRLEDEVHLLRERAIRMSEQRYEQSSHSAIVRKLNERGMTDLQDPSEPHKILK